MRVFTIILLLQSSFIFAQDTQIQIRLVDHNIGFAVQYSPGEVLNFSNDSGLNTIFQTYGITSYQMGNGHPYPPYYGKIGFISSGFNQCIADLNAYNSVVANATSTVFNTFGDALYVKLVSSQIGNPIGTQNGVITTNDTYLNQIFQDFNVFYFEPTFSGNYALTCNCNASQLKVQLDGYSQIIQNTNRVPVAFLSTEEYQSESFKIGPNPASDFIYLNKPEEVKHYSIFDVLGKCLENNHELISGKIDVSNLSANLYILQIEDNSGNHFMQKFIKQ